ncbi:serine hydrolase domain-containing protein [Bacteroidota bacterium]
MKKYILLVVLGVFLFVACCDKNPTEGDFKEYTWNISTPESEGIDTQVLNSAFTQARKLGFVDALLVIRHGSIVAEKYFNGYDEYTPHNVKSISKSFLSAITGIAFHMGYLKNLDDKVLYYFPEYLSSVTDKKKFDITIRHLLTMRMGIERERINYMDIYNSDNWLRETIELPLLSDPGERMRYNTFQTHMLSAIITKATQMNTKKFARMYLTNPMNITINYWEKCPQGYYFGGNSMHFIPRAMATLGYMYLKEGRLNGKQIIPKEWVKLTLSPSTDFSPSKWGALENYNYGYLWWLGQINNRDMYTAWGYGGQFVMVFPQLELIVVSTAGTEIYWETADTQELAILDIISEYILPSIQN